MEDGEPQYIEETPSRFEGFDTLGGLFGGAASVRAEAAVTLATERLDAVENRLDSMDVKIDAKFNELSTTLNDLARLVKNLAAGPPKAPATPEPRKSIGGTIEYTPTVPATVSSVTFDRKLLEHMTVYAKVKGKSVLEDLPRVLKFYDDFANFTATFAGNNPYKPGMCFHRDAVDLLMSKALLLGVELSTTQFYAMDLDELTDLTSKLMAPSSPEKFMEMFLDVLEWRLDAYINSQSKIDKSFRFSEGNYGDYFSFLGHMSRHALMAYTFLKRHADEMNVPPLERSSDHSDLMTKGRKKNLMAAYNSVLLCNYGAETWALVKQRVKSANKPPIETFPDALKAIEALALEEYKIYSDLAPTTHRLQRMNVKADGGFKVTHADHTTSGNLDFPPEDKKGARIELQHARPGDSGVCLKKAMHGSCKYEDALDPRTNAKCPFKHDQLEIEEERVSWIKEWVSSSPTSMREALKEAGVLNHVSADMDSYTSVRGTSKVVSAGKTRKTGSSATKVVTKILASADRRFEDDVDMSAAESDEEDGYGTGYY